MKGDAWGRLAKERADRFWRRMMPELRLFGNYLAGFFFVGLAAMFLYDRLIAQLEPAPWLPAACALPVSAAVAWVRVRTWLEKADPVYLMPAEPVLAGYFHRVMLAAWPGQLFAVAAAALAVWPLYRVQEVMAFRSYVAVIFALLLFKTVNMLLWWRERQMSDGRTRLVFTLSRWLAAWLAVLAGLLWGAAALLSAGATLAAALALCGRFVSRYPVNWEELLALEDRALASWRRFLGQFADTGADGSAAKPNPLARLTGGIRHAPENAYRYVYTLIWLRSPLFGISLRLTATGIVLASVVGDIWLKSGIGALFAVALHVQMKELGRDEGMAERGHLLPLPEEYRWKAARDVRRAAWFICAVPLAIPALLSVVL